MPVTLDPPTGYANLELRQGQTWSQQLLIVDSDLVALDLSSGFTARMQVREYAGAPDPATLTLTNGSGITLQAGTNDEVDPSNIVPNILLALDDEATAAIEAGSYAYDLFVETTSGDVNVPWLAGKFIVKQAVTRA